MYFVDHKLQYKKQFKIIKSLKKIRNLQNKTNQLQRLNPLRFSPQIQSYSHPQFFYSIQLFQSLILFVQFYKHHQYMIDTGQKEGKAQNKVAKAASQSNILKFITEKNSSKKPEGKRCYPHRQLGVSHDSPIEFKGKSTLIADNTLLNSKKESNVGFFNLKNYFNVAQCQLTKHAKSEQKNFAKQHYEVFDENKSVFHRKISKITEFYNKNAWMGNIQYVMGPQRSEKALQLSRYQRQLRVQTARTGQRSKRKLTASPTFRSYRSLATHHAMNKFLEDQKWKVNLKCKEMNQPGRSQSLAEKECRPQTSIDKYHSQTIENSGNPQKSSRKIGAKTPGPYNKYFNVNFLEWNPKRHQNPHHNKIDIFKEYQNKFRAK